eukprot:CAMPEP_0182418898 /NCGR_PEP_ID=MMETSP1167-20130531/3276_1 /TAXON_ID=2988 /ORGANISM="Mallomonas Sp, Strain CCMP3275" /LENGTH=322 /DNA_ID=CAMNT_0024593363 /DNA_START=87 /DNA_END=1055 /DNA_ORIENTATION=+
MKAVICEKYGPPEVLQIRDVEKPIPRDKEILIKNIATTVSSGDWRVRGLNLPPGFMFIGPLILGFNGPRTPILGTELAGVVESVGKNVTKFKVGDEVFAFTGEAMGAHAQYVCLSEDGKVLPKPHKMSFDEAAALSFGGATALDFLKKSNIKIGESILINGATGAVGIAAIQLAVHFGAEVTAVCSGESKDLVTSLGAKNFIDYKSEDFTQNSETYDIIMDTVGTSSFSRCHKSLKEKGRLLIIAGDLSDLLQIPWIHITTDKRVVGGPATESIEQLQTLVELAEAGKYKPVIDRKYKLEEIVEAHRYVDTGRKKGSVVVTF